MSEGHSRKNTLDLPDEELDALLKAVAGLARREISAARDGPIFREPPSAQRVASLLERELELPLEGEPLDALLETCEDILEAGRRTTPGFFGYVLSPAAPVGVGADLLASAANQNVTAWRSAPAATQLEQIALRWLGQFVHFDDEATGILVSGGSIANLVALLLALHDRARQDGDRRNMVVYASEETHYSVAKGAAALGVGLRRVPVDMNRRMAVPALAEAIESDRAAGLEPFCVIGTAGTTSTGAVDPLDAIASVAAAAGLWFHVDGAYGAPAAAVPAQRALFTGMDRADSLAVDPHKWLYVPIDCGALLVHPAGAERGAFAGAGEYVRVLTEETVERFAFWDHGLELSRRFRALKLWMTIRYYGARRLADTIAQDIELAAHMAELVGQCVDLELLSEPSLSICCFRHLVPCESAVELDRHNERLLKELQRGGSVYLSNATLDGHFALRACITNFRTTRDDIERSIALVREVGAGLRCNRARE